ncbi:MAG: MBL fold metallo-hydrolase [Phycisphaerales bacterium]
MEGGTTSAAIRVLGSGSAGNCSVVCRTAGDGERRAVLIDAGLSPRRTLRLLRESGLTLDHVDAVLLTHLDSDHWRIAWTSVLPRSVPILAHQRHRDWGVAQGILPEWTVGFDRPFEIGSVGAGAGTVRVLPELLSHDELGVAAFRFDFPFTGERTRSATPPATLGYATDLGRVTPRLVEHLRGVGVLAIESNYCRAMQLESSRPWALKQRIMGGRGHLSNHEAVTAVAALAPRHVVFLHLSRDCNRAELVADLHAGGDYEFTIAEQHRPTRWVRITPGPPPHALPPVAPPEPVLWAGSDREGAAS